MNGYDCRRDYNLFLLSSLFFFLIMWSLCGDCRDKCAAAASWMWLCLISLSPYILY
ncbi:hypothetical protein F5Y03DRAFT_375817 [Xylaria venustula]|nr:hypothetical protein F5Y03DRAFT_375817 [Xylaria venustula]